ncbi:hypothetical protein GPECTOR_4g641 [Gonium pectorale]|uniref:Uncharacterized protein n=1 Tax=Gonium pectorale TaxID=33097 RepID=A0A150GXD7_GONPE|nr:hypothetical protein GPECTOR_4g641 [Gonium pectorale]|eukprot:KXZ54576.1 hypothetical protein GPECTOR_4g641 [Gonium pectorale]
MPSGGTRARATSLGAVLLVTLVACGLELVRADAARVALYMSEAKDVLDLSWDNGPKNLALELKHLGFDVVASQGQPDLTGANAPDAYVIPTQNGHAFYSAVEDMSAVSSYLAEGGLVVVLDANHGQGEALSSFVSTALGYQGSWGVCKQLQTNAQGSLGEPSLSDFAASFLPGAWPEALEDAQTTSVLSWCRHDDGAAAVIPLYTVKEDEMKVAVQAFGKVGVRGAIVWVGYSWRDGEQAQWGSLLRKLIQDFADGAYEAPKQGNAELHPLHVDSVLESAVDLADEAAEVVRRFLQGSSAPTYPPPGAQLQRPPSPPRPPMPPPLPGYLRTLARSFVVTITETITTIDQLNRIIGNITAIIQKETGAETVTIDYIRTASGTIIFSSLNGTVTITGRRRAMAVAPLRVYHDHEVASMFAACEVVPTRVVLEGEEWLSPAEAREMQEVHAEFYHAVRRFLQMVDADQLEIGMQILAQGAAGRTRSLVWNTDTDFRQQIAPLAPLQLVDPKKAPCPTTCTACPRTWKGTNTSLSVAIFFKEPVQATAVFIKQIRNPGIIRVQFVKWVYPPKGELGANVGKTVYNVTNDPTVCQSVLSIRIGPVKSGIKSAVPAGGTQAKLPRELARTAVGGLLITVDRPQRAGPNYGPFLEWVKVSGRVLYPSDPTVYAGQR